jgi:glycosyltransferase involved in cell wall biosynthesis
LLRNIENELSNCQLTGQVQILVSDNASNDDTQIRLTSFRSTQFSLNYFRQEKNIGFDGNVRFLYENVKTDYVWFFSDDDILLPGAISTVFDGLYATRPDVLLFSFIQPPGSKYRTFNLPDQFAEVTSPIEIIRYIALYPKISIYIFRKIELSNDQTAELQPFYENGFFWIDLCYSIIAASVNSKLCIISQPLAECDDEFNNIRFGPSVFLQGYTIFNHPFVRKHMPNKAEESRIKSYYDVIQLMFAVKMGVLKSDDQALFDKEIKSLRIMLIPLLKNQRAFMQLITLKLRLVVLYKIYKLTLNYIASLKK